MDDQDLRLEKPLSEAVALAPRKPGERHPDAGKAVNEKAFLLDADSYQELKRLERERALRLAVAGTPEMSEEDSAYLIKLRAKSARLDMVCSPLEKAELQAMAQMQGMSVTAYLMAIHRHTVNCWREKKDDPELVARFDLLTEVHFGKIAGEKVLSEMHHAMLREPMPEAQ